MVIYSNAPFDEISLWDDIKYDIIKYNYYVMALGSQITGMTFLAFGDEIRTLYYREGYNYYLCYMPSRLMKIGRMC